PSGRADLSSTSTETPRKLVSSFDHFVTQWMSHGTSSAGRRANSSQLHSSSLPTIPSIRKLHSLGSMRGVGPAVRTGKPGSRYWPGGSRSAPAPWRGPTKPRETNRGSSLAMRRTYRALGDPQVGRRVDVEERARRVGELGELRAV